MKKIIKKIFGWIILIFKWCHSTFISFKSLCLNLRIKVSYFRIIVCGLLALLLFAVVGTIIFVLQWYNIGLSNEYFNGPSISISNPVTILSLSGSLVSISMAVYALAMNAFSKPSKELISNYVDKESDNLELPKAQAVEIIALRYRGFVWSLFFMPFNFPLLGKLFSMIVIFVLMVVQTFIGKFRIFYLIILLSIMIFALISFVFEVFFMFSDKNFFFNKASKIMLSKIHKRLKYIQFNEAIFEKYIPEEKRNIGEKFRKENMDYAKVDIIHAIIFIQRIYESIDYRTDYSRRNYVLDLNKKGHYPCAFLDILKSMPACQIVLKDTNIQQRIDENEYVKRMVSEYYNDGNIILNVSVEDLLKQLDGISGITQEYDEIKKFINECICKNNLVEYIQDEKNLEIER